MSNVVERFIKYVKVNTKSDTSTRVTPSSSGQLELGKLLAEELKGIGMEEVLISDKGYVYATLPKNTDKDLPTIGFIAHMDTSPDMSGENVKPQVVEEYDGGEIILNEEMNVVLSPKNSPEILEYVGQKLITTDGTTLLGADDKAGIAEIITAMEYLINNPEIKHGKVRVCFTPDEEIGEGADNFDVEGFGADFAYTIDGGAIGEIEYENFNAAGVEVIIKGTNVHPGYAKNKMVNSMLVANAFIEMLPNGEVPEKTEGYEGFFHLVGINGEVEQTTMNFIVRDFFDESYNNRLNTIKNIGEKLNEKYGKAIVEVKVKEQYRNMKEKVEPVIHVVDNAVKAMELSGVKPKVRPIRGGTDGARLSFMGLPTPNIFTGGENFHGRYEYIPVNSMEKAVEVIVNIIKLYS